MNFNVNKTIKARATSEVSAGEVLEQMVDSIDLPTQNADGSYNQVSDNMVGSVTVTLKGASAIFKMNVLKSKNVRPGGDKFWIGTIQNLDNYSKKEGFKAVGYSYERPGKTPDETLRSGSAYISATLMDAIVAYVNEKLEDAVFVTRAAATPKSAEIAG